MVMKKPSVKGLDLNIPPRMKIEPFIPKQCALSTKNLQTRALPSQIPPEMNMKLSRMVRVEYFTTLNKIGS